METTLQHEALFLGVDGGQSHTEAVVADSDGRILGRGAGGPSVTNDFAGGDQLERSVRDALKNAMGEGDIPEFQSAHFGLTGELHEEKRVRLSSFIRAQLLTVGHDAPSALYGATAGQPGIVVIAGTGSVVYGENAKGESAQAGGMGYLFSDEGSGFWIGAQAVRLAVLENDGIVSDEGIQRLVCGHFGSDSIRQVVSDFYEGKISRDKLAGIAKMVQEAVRQGGFVTLRNEIERGAKMLAEKVRAVSQRLGFDSAVRVHGVGGMFRGTVFSDMFLKHLGDKCPGAAFSGPRFGPAEGALLLSFKQAGVEINDKLLENLQESQR